MFREIAKVEAPRQILNPHYLPEPSARCWLQSLWFRFCEDGDAAERSSQRGRKAAFPRALVYFVEDRPQPLAQQCPPAGSVP